MLIQCRGLLILALLALTTWSAAQDTSGLHQKALCDVYTSLARQGLPADLSLYGTVETEAGGARDAGTVQLRFRGVEQSQEQFSLSSENFSITFSKGYSVSVRNGKKERLSAEAAATSRSLLVPHQLVARACQNVAMGIEHVPGESEAFEHYRLIPQFKHKELSGLGVIDIWLDRSTGLPTRVSYVITEARGDVTGVAVEISYADYKETKGLVIPHRVEKAVNGTPWAKIEFNRTETSSGLTDADFQVK